MLLTLVVKFERGERTSPTRDRQFHDAPASVDASADGKIAKLWGAAPLPSQGGRMPQPVVHFEVIGKDPTRLRKYFGELFGWEFDVHRPWRGKYRNRRTMVSRPGHLRRRDRNPRRRGRRSGLCEPRRLLRRGPECRSSVATRRETGGNTGHGSSHITDWPCRRAFHRP